MYTVTHYNTNARNNKTEEFETEAEAMEELQKMYSEEDNGQCSIMTRPDGTKLSYNWYTQEIE